MIYWYEEVRGASNLSNLSSLWQKEKKDRGDVHRNLRGGRI